MYSPTTSPDTGSATSSPASADGLSQPDLLGGPMTANSGPAPRRASRSRSPAKAKPRLTIGTCGPTLRGSSVPDGPLSSWESRLRQRLARTGSTECLLTWKASTTPAGRPLSRLVPSTRPTDGTACGLWPTPVANDDNKSPEAHMAMKARMKGGPRYCITSLQVMAKASALWPTPTCNDATGSTHAYGPKQPDGSRVDFLKLPGAARVASGMEHRPSSGTTAKVVGHLNPQFTCWLMGFLPEWDACAPTAMPSRPRSPRK